MSDIPRPESFCDFSYSKLSHFALFQNLPFCSFDSTAPSPEHSDLKVYQDFLCYLFLENNLPKGAKILEVGGGDSRILKHFSSHFECWNMDKSEGMGNGPIQFHSDRFRTVYDYIGTHNPELPSNYFDCVFSISALEHTPEEPALYPTILGDINRVLKPGAYALHCFDIIFDRPFGHWVNSLIPFLLQNAPIRSSFKDAETMLRDPDAYYMSRLAFDRCWKNCVGESYESFGKPASVNLLWQKPRT